MLVLVAIKLILEETSYKFILFRSFQILEKMSDWTEMFAGECISSTYFFTHRKLKIIKNTKYNMKCHRKLKIIKNTKYNMKCELW